MPMELGGELDLFEGTVSDNPIGVSVQVEDYDPDRLFNRAVFHGNDRNLDNSELGTPEVFTPL